MTFTLTTATTEVRALINEASASFWSDTEIQNWIKQGCLDWCEKSLLYIKEDTLTIVTNQVQYTTSGNSDIDNAIRVLHAEHNNKALQRTTFEQIRGHNAPTLASDPAPKYYYDQYDGLTFTVYIGPKPSSTYNGESISCLFAMRTDDITLLPYEYQPHIFLFAASKAKIKERQYQESSLMWQQYINNIMFARRDSLEQEQMTTDKFRIQ
jgi:hypothetical protein